MAAKPVQAIVKAVVRDVVDRCAQKSCPVSENLAAFMVKATALDPAMGFAGDAHLLPADIEKLTETCVRRLAEPSIFRATVAMQIFMQEAYKSREDIYKQHQRDVKSATDDLYRELTDASPRTRPELESFYRKLVLAAMTRGDLGAVTDPGVIRESTAAFESVLPPAELGSFVALDRQKKIAQLEELAQIVCGIRLYNKYTKKGGSNIHDLPTILSDTLAALLAQLLKEYDEYCGWARASAAWLLDPANSASPVRGQVSQAQRNVWQNVIYLEVLLEEACASAPRVKDLGAKVLARVDAIGTIVQSKTAVPTTVIYPQFVELATQWAALQHEQRCLASAAATLAGLSTFAKGKTDLPADVSTAIGAASLPDKFSAVFVNMLATFKAGVDAALAGSLAASVLAPPAGQILSVKDLPGCEVLLPGVTHAYDDLTLLIGGFCPTTLVQTGALLPAYRSIGVLRYHGGVYGVSSIDAAAAFAAAPEKILGALVDAGRANAELIDLLDIHPAVATGPLKNASDAFVSVDASTKCDGGTQTDLHPVDTNIVKDYQWNEWALRRKAIHLANLRNKRTHSSQTDGSSFRRDNTTQVYLPKSVDTQTKVSTGTSVPKPATFVRGLRGDTGDKAVPVQVVDLTLGVSGVSLAAKKK